MIYTKAAIQDDSFSYHCRMHQLQAVRSGTTFRILEQDMDSIRQPIDVEAELTIDTRDIIDHFSYLDSFLTNGEFDKMQLIVIDSNIACTRQVCIDELRRIVPGWSERTLYILVDNQVSYVETEYKRATCMRDLRQTGMSRYQNALPHLAEYDVFMDQVKNNMINNMVYMNTSMAIYHKIMQQVEIDYMGPFQNIQNGVGVRNELNDDFQVMLLVYLQDVLYQFGVGTVMLTNDNQLRNKCAEWNIQINSVRGF